MLEISLLWSPNVFKKHQGLLKEKLLLEIDFKFKIIANKKF
jgi:hypothetical protein